MYATKRFGLTVAALALVSVAGRADAGIALQYTFQDGNLSGTDVSGYGHNGTKEVFNSSTLVTGPTAAVPDAVHFASGYRGGISTGATTSALGIEGASFTVMAWVNLDNSYPTDEFVFGTDGSLPMHIGFRNRMPYFGFFNNDSAASGVVAAGEWHQYAWRYDAGAQTQQIFIDGQSVVTTTVLSPSGTTHPSYNQEEIVTVGDAYSSGLVGSLADLRLYNNALTASDIQGVYQGDLNPAATPEPSTVAMVASALPLGLGYWLCRRLGAEKRSGRSSGLGGCTGRLQCQ